MKNQPLIPASVHCTKVPSSVFSSTHKNVLLLLFCLIFIQAAGKGQTIWFNSTPVTTVDELGSYSYTIQACSDNGGVNFSATGLPAWLTLSPGTQGPKQLNNTSIGNTTGGVAMDADGNFYVANYYFTAPNKIYKVDKDGNTTDFATKTSAPQITRSLLVVGDSLYVAYYTPATGKIARYDLKQANPIETNAFNVTGIVDMTYRNGAIYGVQQATKKIIRMDIATNVVTDFLVLPNTPRALAFDQNGDLLFIDNTGALYRYSFSTSSYAQVASGFPTIPSSLLVDAAGQLFMSSTSAKIRRYDPTFASYIELPFTPTICYDMCLSKAGTLVYGDYSTGFIYDLGSHATLTGNPTHADVGVYPISITSTSGAITTQHQFTITVTDPNAPLLTSTTPVNAAIDIPGSQPVVLTFNEQIKAGTGNIEIRRVDNDALIESIDVTNTSKVGFDNETVTLSHNDIPNSTNVYISIPAGVIVDNSDNPFAGFTTSSTLAYTTFGCTATLTAADGMTNIPPNSFITLSASAGTAYSWIKDNTAFSAASGSTYSASAAGNYAVVVTNSQGCQDTSNVVRLEQYSGEPILMPKLFSPNGDGFNDIIKPITPGLKTFIALKIYNRWGNLIFESRDREKGWDGKLGGKPQPTDSYVWICTGIDYYGRARTKKGILSLIR